MRVIYREINSLPQLKNVVGICDITYLSLFDDTLITKTRAYSKR